MTIHEVFNNIFFIIINAFIFVPVIDDIYSKINSCKAFFSLDCILRKNVILNKVGI
jgi:hypothetical protein